MKGGILQMCIESTGHPVMFRFELCARAHDLVRVALDHAVRLVPSVLLVGMVLLAGCATRPPAVAPALLDKILAGPRVAAAPDLLSLTPELVAYVDARVDSSLTPRVRLNRLRRMLFAEDQMGLKYDIERTRTASETFASRRGNCLSMTSLYIAMARHVGLDAHYSVVPTLPWWDRTTDTMIWNEHINATGTLRNDEHYVLDLIPQPPAALNEARKTVTDQYALALFHSNRGAEALVKGEMSDALAEFRAALTLEPRLSDAWNNAAVVLRRTGRQGLAEAAMLHALTLDRSNYAAMNNLASLYQRQGKTEQSLRYQRRIRAHRQKNPWFHHAAAEQALEAGEVTDAIASLKRALKLAPGKGEFYLLLQVAHREIGEIDKSEQYGELEDTALAEAETYGGERMRIVSPSHDGPTVRSLLTH